MTEYFEKLVKAVQDGDEYALKAYTELYQIGAALDEAKAIVYDLAIREAETYPEKSFQYNGFRIEKANSATRWDFSKVDEITQLETRVKELKEAYKQAFDSYSKNIFEVVTAGGEVPVLPTKTEGKPIIKLSKIDGKK